MVSGASSHLIPCRDSRTGTICLQVYDGLGNSTQPKPSRFWASALSSLCPVILLSHVNNNVFFSKSAQHSGTHQLRKIFSLNVMQGIALVQELTVTQRHRSLFKMSWKTTFTTFRVFMKALSRPMMCLAFMWAMEAVALRFTASISPLR